MPFQAAVCTFFLALATDAATKPDCTTFPEGRICHQLKENTKVGRSTRYRIWVEGTREPVELRVHNSSPTVIRLEGEDDQLVRTSGGPENEAQVKVKGLRVGAARIRVHPYSREVKQEAAWIAAEIAPHLETLQADFDRKRGALRKPHRRQDVAELLDRTEAALLAILSYRELAALRDHVRAVFREAREGWEESQPSFASRRVVVLATYRFAQRRDSTDESGLASVVRLIARLLDLSKNKEYVVDLCVTSWPKNGAWFDMEPESYAAGGREIHTPGMIVNLYRGRYVYQATLKPGKPIECRPGRGSSCRPLDLIDDPSLLLICDFDAGRCRRSADPLPEGCRGNER